MPYGMSHVRVKISKHCYLIALEECVSFWATEISEKAVHKYNAIARFVLIVCILSTNYAALI